MPQPLALPFLLFWLMYAYTPSGSLGGNGASLTVLTPNECGTCLGHQLLYECITVGTIGTTVWKGSAFQCPDNGNNVLLSHRQFSSGTMDACNNGAIVGRSIRAVNNCYISQLNVTVSASMNGQTIQCFYNNESREIEIGIETITIREDPFLPPNEVHVSDIYLDEGGVKGSIAFNWSSVQDNCPALHYDLTNINCGTCPDIARTNQATCYNVSIGDICTFAVSTVACDVIMGGTSSSASTTVTLKVPTLPVFHSVPLYSATDGYLKSITTTFGEAEPFTISTGIDGSATSYTITYLDSRFGGHCGSATIPVSHCEGGICCHVFSVKDSNCPPCIDVNITAFATNLLGNGALSDMITLGSINEFVKLEFDALLSSIRCVFKQLSTSEKQCSIIYGPGSGERCAEQLLTRSSEGRERDSTTVVIDHLLLQNESQFCSVVTASDGILTVSIEMILHKGCSPQQLSDDTLVLDKMTCGAPLHTLGIRNGIVCYDSIDVGASAVYFCSRCGCDNTMMTLSARTCLPNGSWSGMIPQCEIQCDLMSSTGLPVTIITTTSIGVVSTIVIVILTTVIVILARAKYKVQVELKELQSRTNVLYEEIVTPPTSTDLTCRNVAYDCVTK